MTTLTADQTETRLVKVLKDSFGPDVRFELLKESDTVYRVKATSDDDDAIADGLQTLKAARLRGAVDGGLVVKMISHDDADDYAARGAAASDPMLRVGYDALATDARGQ